MFKLLLPFLLISPAFAYLDPGTGSMLLYFIMGVIATVVYFLKGIFYKIKAFITGGKIDKGLRDLDGADILFYSEGGHYWNVFLPVIEELEKRAVKSVYYTSGEKDPALETAFKYMSAHYIGNDLTAFTLLNNIKVKIMIITTPQLDVMHLKRSKNVDHYVHLIHSPTDVLLYKKFAFDYFDSVMCSGKHQIENIQALDEIRNLPKKVLYETGLTYYDVMYRNRDQYIIKEKNKTVLVAPTWGSNGMLTKFGVAPVKELLEANYHVILRPHPQMYVSQKELMMKLESELASYTNFELDRKLSGDASMGRSDVMISDLSGIIFDFFFIYEKPVIVIEDVIERGGFEAEDIDNEIWESTILNKVATLVNHNNINTLPHIVDQLVDKDITQNIKQLRDQSLFNFAHAGVVAADQILEIIKK